MPNHALFQSRFSVRSFVEGAARHLGAESLPDVGEIAGHVASTVGTDSFGVPRWPEGHRAPDLPINYVTHLWPAVKPVLESLTAAPSEWPILLGLAAQKAMLTSKDALDPAVAARIVLECAAPMGKIDPCPIDQYRPAAPPHRGSRAA